MKEFRFRIILILGAVALSLYLLYPTYADSQNTKSIKAELTQFSDSVRAANPQLSEDRLDRMVSMREDEIYASNPDYRTAREKRVKLGLDLQGGMYLVMEVNTAKLLEKLAKDPDQKFMEILNEAEQQAKIEEVNVVSVLAQKLQQNNIRLSRYFGSIRQDDSEIISTLEDQESDAVTRAIEIIRNRVDQYGVSEPSIQRQGARRIIVELPGISKEEDAKRLLQGSALLEFKIVREADFTIQVMNAIDSKLAELLKTGSDTTIVSDTTAVEDMTEEQFAREHPFFSVALINPQSPYADAFVRQSDKPKLESYLARPEIQNVIPDNVLFAFWAKPEAKQDGEDIYRLALVNKKAELTGGVIVDAQSNIDPQTSAPIVNMQMNSEGAREWARITGANIDKRCAIILDGVIYSAPTIRNKIPSGNSVIEGIGDLTEAKLLEIVLKAGALPAPVDIIEERTVGPSLGQDSISQGFSSTLIGFLLVAVFMIFYYSKTGAIADLSLFFTVLFIMGILAGFNATLTLPGIAGIILTIGMAVDANVIIYERIREELSTGKTIRAAIQSGYSNSYSAIFDSNITTFFTGVILYQFGSGPVQGFALTLMIGIVCSLFAALVVTRVVLDMMAAKGMKVNIG
ncbi:protein-export membrane protein secd [hydrocarbon metagenome]|uniref:Protein-export membrane protein secd n=1 Tax=hydrocarbon metagenome TaxID=938273 RepID=A0A0W8FZ12_9ZZZZ